MCYHINKLHAKILCEEGMKKMGATYKGGVHPYDGKELSMDKPIKDLLPKGDLVFPLMQHLGKPAKPIVSKGDYVLKGQKIGQADGFISANVISSVSGKVKAVEPRLTASGFEVLSVVIENDNEYKTVEGYGVKRDPSQLTKEEIRSIIEESGIVGLGGASFPTHVKLTPKDDNKIDYFIVNATECEPYLTNDYRLMMEEPEKVIGGLKIVLSMFPNAKGIIAIEDNKPKAIELLNKHIEGDSNIKVHSLDSKYPQGGERQVIYSTTGRETNSSLLPADVGCLVNNVSTIAAIYSAVADSTPLLTKITTITGDAIREPQNFRVLNGTSMQEVIDAAGGFVTEPEKIVCGGPMMGYAIYNLDVPVSKYTSGLLCLSTDENAYWEQSACIHCGRCVDVCPANLMPQQMYKFSSRFDEEGFIKIDGLECIECGCCSYICPAKIRLTQSFRETKRSIQRNNSVNR